MTRRFLLGMALLFFCEGSPVFAVEIAPRITDREIVESLAKLQQGQQNIDKRFDDLRIEMNHRFEGVDKRFEGVDKRFVEVGKRFDDLRADMNKRFEAVDRRFEAVDRRFDDLNRRMDTSHQTMLALFGALITLIVALFGYIAWDRRTLVKPLQEKLTVLEYQQTQEIQSRKADISRMDQLLDALRQLSQEDQKLASVLRSFSLL